MPIQVKSLSYSTVSQFINCPERVWLEKIEHVPKRGGVSVKMLFGISLHSAVASFYRGILNHVALNLDTLFRTFRIKFDSISCPDNPDNPKAELLQQAHDLLSMFIELEPPNSIIAIERPYRFMLTAKLEAVCCPDIIVRDADNVLTIIDIKTSGKKYAEDQLRKVGEQVLLYGLRFAEPIKARTLLFIRKKKPVIEDIALEPDIEPSEIISKFSMVQKALECGIHFRNKSWMCNGCPYHYVCFQPVAEVEQVEEERRQAA